jgi:hypothetical protein
VWVLAAVPMGKRLDKEPIPDRRASFLILTGNALEKEERCA